MEVQLKRRFAEEALPVAGVLGMYIWGLVNQAVDILTVVNMTSVVGFSCRWTPRFMQNSVVVAYNWAQVIAYLSAVYDPVLH